MLALDSPASRAIADSLSASKPPLASSRWAAARMRCAVGASACMGSSRYKGSDSPCPLARLLRCWSVALTSRPSYEAPTKACQCIHLLLAYICPSGQTTISPEGGGSPDARPGARLHWRHAPYQRPTVKQEAPDWSPRSPTSRSSVAGTARTLSQYNSAIEIRSKLNETVNELAKWSHVPVINGMDHDRHPCQSMSDALTILEHAGTLGGVTFAYVGDAAHPCNSLSTTLSKLGLNVRIGNATGYELSPELTELAAGFAAESGGSFLLTDDPLEAIAGADFIYTDCWWW